MVSEPSIPPEIVELVKEIDRLLDEVINRYVEGGARVS